MMDGFGEKIQFVCMPLLQFRLIVIMKVDISAYSYPEHGIWRNFHEENGRIGRI